MSSSSDLKIAVLVPCYNEQAAIGKVVRDFREALPSAAIYVYDNNSSDETKLEASKAGAVVRTETRQGKGNVVCRMFADVQADIYVLVDGDDTYDASAAPGMVALLLENQLDMVNGRRVTDAKSAYRLGHRFGNKLLTGMVARIFGDRFRDMLSGYRVFSRRFVKSFPALSSGFEIETQITVHALALQMPTAEIDTIYKDRPRGSTSKLRTYSDGWRILKTIVLLLKEEKPLAFFCVIGYGLFLIAVGLSVPVIFNYLVTGLVPRVPTTILSAALMTIAFLSVTSGFILDTVTLGRREAKRMRYLDIPAPDTQV
jgi:glycosyltransferase involved in cell wall biosynthesis